MMEYIRLFFLIYVVVVALTYALLKNAAKARLVPGDIFIQKAGRVIYIPLGSSLLLTGLIFAALFRFLK